MHDTLTKNTVLLLLALLLLTHDCEEVLLLGGLEERRLARHLAHEAALRGQLHAAHHQPGLRGLPLLRIRAVNEPLERFTVPSALLKASITAILWALKK